MKITFLVSGSVRSNFSYRPLALARSLRALGHDVSIIAPSADKYNDFKIETISVIDDVRILQPFQFATKRLEINLFPYLFIAAWSLLREKPDLVYIYKPTPVSVVGLLAKLFRGTETVVDFDDLGSEVMKIEGHPRHQIKLVEWSERLAAKYADRLVVASTYLSEMYKQEFANKPVQIIPNGVESDWFDAPVASKNQKRIVFMGAINRKNILEPLFDVLPEVVRKHSDVEVLIIGDGTSLNYFKEKITALNLSNHVTFLGWLPLEEAKPLLHAGDIGYNYMPNEVTTRAASNMKVPQYMARGVVPLVSDIGDLAVTVDHGEAGYIAQPDDLESLKNTILAALEDTDRMKKSKYATLLVSKKINWNRLGRSFHDWVLPTGRTKKVLV
jgi:glycosyltransferase involved in cell wall biosynthesis